MLLDTIESSTLARELFKVNKLFLSKIFLKSVKSAFFKNSDLYESNGVVIENLFFFKDFLPNSDQKSLDQLLYARICIICK